MHSYYYKIVMPKVKLSIAEFKAEMGKEGLCMSYEATWNRLQDIKARIVKLKDEYVRLDKQPWASRSDIPNLVKANNNLVKRLQSRMKSIVDEYHGRKPEITDDMIGNAREYALSEIITIINNKATCVNPEHKDNTPSMNCKNNFAYCHVCQWQGDAIRVYMEVHGVSFKQAVKEMQ